MLKKFILLLSVFSTTTLCAALSTEQNYAFLTLNDAKVVTNNYLVPFIPNAHNVIGSGITFSGNSLQVSKSGVYRLSYTINAKQTNIYNYQDVSLSAGLSLNGVAQFGEIESSQWGMDNYIYPETSSIIPTRNLRTVIHHYLNAGDTISLVMRTNSATGNNLYSLDISFDMTANLSLYRLEPVRIPFATGYTTLTNTVYGDYGQPTPVTFTTTSKNPGGSFTFAPDNKSICINQAGVYMASYQASTNVISPWPIKYQFNLNNYALLGSKIGVLLYLVNEIGNVYQHNVSADCMFYANVGDILTLYGTTWNPSSIGNSSVGFNIIKLSNNQIKSNNKAPQTFGYFNGTQPYYPNDGGNIPFSSADAATNPDFTYINPSNIQFKGAGNYKVTYQLNFITNTAIVNGVPDIKPMKTQLLLNGAPVAGSIWGADLKPYKSQSKATNKITVDMIFSVQADDILNLNIVTGSWVSGLSSTQRSNLALASASIAIMKVSDSD